MNTVAVLPKEVLKAFETVPDLYLLLSPALVILTASDAFLEVMLTKREKIKDKYIFEAFADYPGMPLGYTVENLKPSLEEVLRTRQPHRITLLHLSTSDVGNFEQTYWSVLNTPVLDEEGEIAYIIHKIHQETEPVNQRHLIQQQEEHHRLKEALALGHIGSFEWSDSNETIYWSDEMYRIHGLELAVEPVTLDKIIQFTHPDDRERFQEFVNHTRAVAGISSISYRIIRPDGMIRHLIRHIQSWANATGDIQNISGTVQDITEQQQIQAQLKEQANFIHQVTATVPDMVSVIELSTRHLEYINRQSLPASGFTYEGLKDASPQQRSKLIHPDYRQAVQSYFASFATATDEDVRMLEYQAKDHSVEWQWFLVRGRVFRRNASGAATHCLNVIQNITLTKLTQEEIRKHLQVL